MRGVAAQQSIGEPLSEQFLAATEALTQQWTCQIQTVPG